MTFSHTGANVFEMTTSPAALGCTPSLRSVLPWGNTAATSAMKIGDAVVFWAFAQAGIAALRASTLDCASGNEMTVST